MKLRDRGYVDIELDRKRQIKFDLKAARMLEKALGKPLVLLNESSVGITEMITLFWAGMLHDPPNKFEWDIEKAEELMMEAESIEYVMTKISEALTLFFGENQAKKN